LFLTDMSDGETNFIIKAGATTTSIPTSLTATNTNHYVGRFVKILAGPLIGETRAITAYDPTTGTLTVSAFSASPTEEASLVTNGAFASNPVATTPDTIQNGWQWAAGGTATVAYSAGAVALTGDETNAGVFDTTITTVVGEAYQVTFKLSAGTVDVRVGASRGDNADASVTRAYGPDDEGGVSQAVTFVASATTSHIRFANQRGIAAIIDDVRAALALSDTTLVGVRAQIIAYAEVNQTWTARTDFKLQTGGGPTIVGGALSVAGVSTLSGVVTASAGGTGLSVTNDASIGGTLSVTGAATLSGAVTASAAGTGLLVTNNASIGGTLSVTGAATLSGAVTASAGGTGLSVSNNASIGGTLSVTGAMSGLGVVTLAPSGTTPTSITGTSLYVAGATAAATGVVVDAYGAQGRVTLRRANGSAAAPSALVSGDVIGSWDFRGRDSSGYSAGAQVSITGTAREAWTTSARGASLGLWTTNIGTTSLVERARLHPSGNLVIGSPLDDDGVAKLSVVGGSVKVSGAYGSGDVLVQPTAASNSVAAVVKVRSWRSTASNQPRFGGRLVTEAFSATDALHGNNKILGGMLGGGNTDLAWTVGYPASILFVADASWVDANNAATAISMRTGLVASVGLEDGTSYGTEALRLTSAQRALFGAPTDNLTDRVQVNGAVNVSSVFKVGGAQVIGAPKTGWGTPTGTLSRATFDSGTVTLSQLAQVVAALVTDAKTHHGFLAA
jgi:hypothetical protein